MYRFNFKFLLILLVGCFAFESHACRWASKGSGDHLVVTIEGLGGRWLGSQAMRSANALNRGNYTVLSCAQDTDPEFKIASMISNYKRQNPNARITVMGHSLGGGDAVRLLARTGVTIDDLVVWDGRNGSEFRCGNGNGPKYRRPGNVKRVTNFYQCGFMPGRRFHDEACVRNVQLGGSHVGLPSRSRGTVNGILNGARPGVGAQRNCHASVDQPQRPTTPTVARPNRPVIPILGNLFRPRQRAPRNPRVPVVGTSNGCSGPTQAQIRKHNLSASGIAKWCKMGAGGKTYGEHTEANYSSR